MNLAARIRAVAELKGEFRLRSGATSSVYFDKYRFESDPDLLHAIAVRMTTLVPYRVEVLCGLEMGGIPLVTMLSQRTRIPAAFIRKEAKAYGTCRYAEGPELAGKKLLLVEDVVSSGGAILEAAAKLRADGCAVDAALCVIDRETGGREALAEVGLELDALFTMSQIQGAP